MHSIRIASQSEWWPQRDSSLRLSRVDAIGTRGSEASKPGGFRGVVRLQCRIAGMPDTTMRAAFYEGARKFSTGRIAMPTRGPDEALLRVRRVGICGTDLHIFQGHLDHRVPKRGIIGHEIFAEVVEAPREGGFKSGDRVVVEPVTFCGRCRA